MNYDSVSGLEFRQLRCSLGFMVYSESSFKFVWSFLMSATHQKRQYYTLNAPTRLNWERDSISNTNIKKMFINLIPMSYIDNNA